jgi:CRP-like cAMP-binding protein
MKILSKLGSLLGNHDKPDVQAVFVLDVHHLQKLVPFNEMPESHLGEILKIAQVSQQPSGKKLFKRGQDDTQVHYLLEGNINLLDEDFNITPVSASDPTAIHALDNETPHRFSAITKGECRMLQFDKDRLDLLMTWEQAASSEGEDSGEDEDWMSALLESELFTKVPPAHIQQLFATFKTQKAGKGEVIVQEGQQGDRFYVLASGKAVVTRRRVDGEETLAELGAGRFFGEEALIGETTRNATITMTSPGKLMYLDKEQFKKLLEEPVLRTLRADEIEQLRAKGQALVLLDIRLSGEFKHAHAEGSINVPLNRLRDRMKEFAREKLYIVSGNAGRRSELGVYLLISGGFQAYLGQVSD